MFSQLIHIFMLFILLFFLIYTPWHIFPIWLICLQKSIVISFDNWIVGSVFECSDNNFILCLILYKERKSLIIMLHDLFDHVSFICWIYVLIFWIDVKWVFVSLNNSGCLKIVMFFLAWIQSLHWLITLLLTKPLQLLLNQLLSISKKERYFRQYCLLIIAWSDTLRHFKPMHLFASCWRWSYYIKGIICSGRWWLYRVLSRYLIKYICRCLYKWFYRCVCWCRWII